MANKEFIGSWESYTLLGVLAYLLIGFVYFLLWPSKCKQRFWWQLAAFELLWVWIAIEEYRWYRKHGNGNL